MAIIEVKTEGYLSGVQNKIPSEVISRDAASDELSWITQNGVIELARGRALVGAEGALGGVYGEIFAPKKDGTTVHFRKVNTVIQYYNGTTWVDTITGLTDGAEYSFTPYISLAGAYVYATGVDGFYKIATANPGSYFDMYDVAKNYKGFSVIDSSRMFLWDRSDGTPDKTGLYLSKIDPQGTNYTTVSAEVLGASGTDNYTGTLAAVAGVRCMFGLVVTGTTASGVETFTDDYTGVLTGSLGGTGTINYLTGAYDITFSENVSSGNVLVNYLWEDSNVGGITDFTFSGTRLAGEGDIIPQEFRGESIQSVQVFEGKYYSFKTSSVYELDLTIDDTNATNNVFRVDIGIPSKNAVTSTGSGMVFMDTANIENPILSILKKNPVGGNLEPINLTPIFDWSDYLFDQCVLDTWGENILVSARTKDSTVNNRTFLVNTTQKYSVDITYYGANTFAKEDGILYAGSSVTDSVYTLFTGFDDLGDLVENYWIGKDDTFGEERLKRVRYLRFKGLIDRSQSLEIYASLDNGGFELLGTIVGSGSYVDYTDAQNIGSNMLGTQVVGGGEPADAYPYLMQMRIKLAKFRSRQLKFVAIGIGYASVQWEIDSDILTYEQKIPKRFRQKQNVSLDGLSTDQDV
jgi:hypothetical protein